MVTRAKTDLQGNGASPVSREREGRLDYQENKGCRGDQVSLGIQAETVSECVVDGKRYTCSYSINLKNGVDLT